MVSSQDSNLGPVNCKSIAPPIAWQQRMQKLERKHSNKINMKKKYYYNSIGL